MCGGATYRIYHILHGLEGQKNIDHSVFTVKVITITLVYMFLLRSREKSSL